MKRRLAFLVLFASLTFGQEEQRIYRVFRAITATSSVVVIKQPTSGGRPLRLEGGFVKGAGAFSYKLSINGATSGGSPGTPAKRDDRAVAPTASMLIDPTVTGDETIITEDFSAAGERVISGGLRLKVESGTQKQIVVTVTADSPTKLYTYFEFSEPSAP